MKITLLNFLKRWVDREMEKQWMGVEEIQRENYIPPKCK